MSKGTKSAQCESLGQQTPACSRKALSCRFSSLLESLGSSYGNRKENPSRTAVQGANAAGHSATRALRDNTATQRLLGKGPRGWRPPGRCLLHERQRAAQRAQLQAAGRSQRAQSRGPQHHRPPSPPSSCSTGSGAAALAATDIPGCSSELWNATNQTGSRGWQWDSEGCAGTDGDRSLPPSLLSAAPSLSRTSRPFWKQSSAVQSRSSAACVGTCRGQQEYLPCCPAAPKPGRVTHRAAHRAHSLRENISRIP